MIITDLAVNDTGSRRLRDDPRIHRLNGRLESTGDYSEIEENQNERPNMKRSNLAKYGLTMLTASTALLGAGGTARAAAAQKPNILVIWGDDIGPWNVGASTHGMMGRTTNIDNIAKQGALFTDHYAQPSCTAGRAAFLMGQLP